MKQQISEIKRFQKIAGILNESQLNELDPKVDELRKEYLKQLDVVGIAISKLHDIGTKAGGLFSVDKKAEELSDKFFDEKNPSSFVNDYNELYKYVTGKTAPKLAEDGYSEE